MVQSWITKTANDLPIKDSQKISSALGGAAFGRSDSQYKFSTLINNLTSSDAVKYVVIAGGYNDRNSIANIATGISDCKSLVQSKFPNATMCVAFIAGTTDESQQSALASVKSAYQSACSSLGCVFLNNTDVLSSASYFASDGIHPNESGETRIANAIVNAMNDQLL